MIKERRISSKEEIRFFVGVCCVGWRGLEEDVGEGGEGDGGPEDDALDEGLEADGLEGVE